MAKYKFKIGDRVRMIDYDGNIPFGELGTIKEESYTPPVNWDKPHRCTYKSGNGNNIWCTVESRLKLVNETEQNYEIY